MTSANTMRAFTAALGLGLPLCLAAGPASADDVASFYKGKQIQLVIGYDSGGGYDTYARLAARHMSRHIPGNPTIVPQNMPGAGSRKAANWLYNVAPQDGSVIATVGQNTPMDQALKESGIQFDSARLNWIGNFVVDNNVLYVRADTGIETIADLKAKGGVICGGSGASSPSILNPQLLNNLIDAKIKIISGYPGGNAVNLAVERKEVNCRGSNSWASMKATQHQQMQDRAFNFLVQYGPAKNPEISTFQGRAVPLVTDLATTDADRRAVALIVSGVGMGRPLVAPPNVPEARVAALRKAFDDTMKDPEFVAEAKKLNMDLDPLSGVEIQKIATETVTAPDDVVKRARALLERRDVEAIKGGGEEKGKKE